MYLVSVVVHVTVLSFLLAIKFEHDDECKESNQQNDDGDAQDHSEGPILQIIERGDSRPIVTTPHENNINNNNNYSTNNSQIAFQQQNKSKTDDVDEESTPCWKSALHFLNLFVVYCGMCFAILCVSGAVVYAETAVNYILTTPDDTKIFKVGDYDIHYICFGPRVTNSSGKLYILDADISHGIGEQLPLLRELGTRSQRRVCAFDKLGFGSSSYFKKSDSSEDFSSWYDPLILHLLNNEMRDSAVFSSTNNTNALILVGWGGGSNVLYRYATRQPQFVAGIVFQNGYFDNVEWTVRQQRENFTNAETDSYRAGSLMGRRFLFGVIRVLGVNWGIMSVFVPKSARTFAWPEMIPRANWPFLRSKTWETQFYTLQLTIDQADEQMPSYPSGYRGNFADGVSRFPSVAAKPLLQIANNRTRNMICNEAPTTPLSAKDCDNAVKEEQFLFQNAVDAARNVSYSPTISGCDDLWQCDLWYLQSVPADAVRRILGWVKSEGLEED